MTATPSGWLASENEADFAGLWTPITEERLAWGIRRDNPELLQSVNGILQKWKQDGTLDMILKKWLPYLYRIQ